MQITSSAFKHNEIIPQKYTCDGEDVNPPLSWSGVPENTKSLALIVDDPDAPVGPFVHWVVWNIAPDTLEIIEGKIPDNAVVGTTSFDRREYGGPCLPDSEHNYFFKLYALDIELNISGESDSGQLEEVMVGHVMETAELVGQYSR